MTAFNQTLPLGADKPGDYRAGPSPGPVPCDYCANDAYLLTTKLPCGRKPERLCPAHFVMGAKKHGKCRTCFREATINGREW